MQSWKLDEKQMRIEIESFVGRYFREREGNYHELIVVEREIDWFPRKYGRNFVDSQLVLRISFH